MKEGTGLSPHTAPAFNAMMMYFLFRVIAFGGPKVRGRKICQCSSFFSISYENRSIQI